MSELLKDGDHRVMQLLQPKPTHTPLAVSTVSAQSAAFPQPCFVELYCETTCFVAIGVNPTATLTSIPVYAGRPRTLKVGAGEKIAGILAAGTDTLRPLEML